MSLWNFLVNTLLLYPSLDPYRRTDRQTERRIERGQSRWRVGWHGLSCWLLCLCVLYFLFCAASKTIRCSWVSPYLIFWKIKIMSYVFRWVPTFIDQITTGKKGTVVWPSQTTIPFFFGVLICNLIKEPAKKYSDEPAKTIRHCNRWPDDCPFFSVVIFDQGTRRNNPSSWNPQTFQLTDNRVSCQNTNTTNHTLI